MIGLGFSKEIQFELSTIAKSIVAAFEQIGTEASHVAQSAQEVARTHQLVAGSSELAVKHAQSARNITNFIKEGPNNRICSD
ncbi:hypothetical protein O9H85_18595 [Paenibacillus filicis]|uniref:Methyl-accepting transducer domain-containing protein n=1 Tax=Paenibacillus gyeongsangnamensis TaxID=3388067 RepID=A0ABT4QC40_9BACL|nr:hypothetical protein [Paenibacillus filicis]MCZ8514394.1 hypothetical protein [Paenibacillus filicis]